VLTRLAPEPRRTSPRIPLAGNASFLWPPRLCLLPGFSHAKGMPCLAHRQAAYGELSIPIDNDFSDAFPGRPVALANQSRSAIRTDSPRNRSDSNFLVISSNFPYAGSRQAEAGTIKSGTQATRPEKL